MSPPLCLAVDPGTRKAGLAVLQLQDRKLHLLAAETLKTGTGSIEKRLSLFQTGLQGLIDRFEPAEMVVERAFFRHNAASALRLAECRGVALALAGGGGAKVSEYTALEAKRAVTGRGNAAKSAVQDAVQRLLGLEVPPEPDAADAIALGICHAMRHWNW